MTVTSIKYLALRVFFTFIFIHGTYTISKASEELFFQDQSEYQELLVVRVVSANTLVLENRERVVLIGLRAPEPPPRKEVEVDQHNIIVKKIDPEKSLEELSYNFAKDLLEGKKVRLEFDVQPKDDEFNTLAYVFLPDGTMANAEILRQGYADLRTIPPNTKYADQLRAAYQEARKEKRGLQGQ